MRRNREKGPFRKHVAILGLCALAALAGCNLVGDNVTGVQLRQGPTECIQECNDTYKALYDEEQKLHRANVEACQSLSGTDRNECLEQETLRHAEAMLDLGEGKVECQNNCHRQGTGSAG